MASKKYIRYDDEFKARALKLWAEGKSKAEVCAELGMSNSAFDSWIAAAKRVPGPDPSGMSVEELLRENRKQALRIKHLEMEKDVLEKATAFFAAKRLP